MAHASGYDLLRMNDRLTVPSSPVDQQRNQSRNDNQRKDRCDKASAWSGKIEEDDGRWSVKDFEGVREE